jgi:hypothetical protein
VTVVVAGRSRGEPAGFARRAPTRFGEAEREGASVASGCGGEGAGPEVPEGGSERGGGGQVGRPKSGANPLRVSILMKSASKGLPALASACRLTES